MRELDNLNISTASSKVSLFDCLPDRAKEVFFATIKELAKREDKRLCEICSLWMEDYYECKSPIEKIFMIAMNFVYILRADELKENDVGFFIFPQCEIECERKTFYSDFYICIDRIGEEVSVLVECDGHDFHQKTKKQVEYDNEREYEIKKQGYDILRFSGSQIYNNPFKCANDVFDYLMFKEERVG